MSIEPRAFRGVWIPAALWLSPEISPMAKMFLVEIDSLSRLEHGCIASNAHFGELFGLSTSRVSEIISGLRSDGHVLAHQMPLPDGLERRQLHVVGVMAKAFGIPNPPSEKAKPPFGKGEAPPSEKAKRTNTSTTNTIEEPPSPRKRGELVVAASLPSWLDPKAWAEWCQHRRGRKWTDAAQAHSLRSLDKLRQQGNDPAEVISQSIAAGWTGLFAVKGGRGGGSSKPDPRGDVWREMQSQMDIHPDAAGSDRPIIEGEWS